MEISLCLGRFPTKTEVSAIDVSATTKKRQGAWLPAVEVLGVMMARPTLLRHHGVHRLLCVRFVCRLLTREDTSFDAHGVLLRIVGSRFVFTVPKTASGGVDVGELMHLHALPLNGVLEVGNYLPAVAVIPSGAVRLEHIRNVVAIPCSDDLSLVTLRSVVLLSSLLLHAVKLMAIMLRKRSMRIVNNFSCFICLVYFFSYVVVICSAMSRKR
nr:MAG TPA: hypothetical protein [Caudoviricetes sp.]